MKSAAAPVGPKGAFDLFGKTDVRGFHPGLLSGMALAGANPVQVPASGPAGRSRTLWLIDENAASRVPEQLVRKAPAGS